MLDLIQGMTDLKKNHGVIGIKQSFEDEGVLYHDIIHIKRFTETCGLETFVKIGGCEAKSDLFNCIRLGVNSAIAPMVETSFAASKFLEMIGQYKNKIDPFILIETKTAFENLDEILKISSKLVKGIIIGRSDFSKSYELNKSEVDSNFIFDKVEQILKKCKSFNLLTTMGGNISVKSVEFIKKMYSLGLLDRIETRNIVISLNDENVLKLDDSIRAALDLEIEWLKFKLETSSFLSTEYTKRIDLLLNRQ
jgi:hypothetical protein